MVCSRPAKVAGLNRSAWARIAAGLQVMERSRWIASTMSAVAVDAPEVAQLVLARYAAAAAAAV